jgi:phage-related baseplate assembly protein
MNPPNVLKTYDYEKILQSYIAYLQSILENYQPSDGDVLQIENQSTAYRELLLRSEFNTLAKAFFLMTATGDDLDHHATFYDIERLEGAKPTANYRFELTSPLTYEVIVPAGSVLTDDGGQYQAVLLEEARFGIGEEVATAKVELQHYTSYSEVYLTTLQTPLPYIGEIQKEDFFRYGAEIEDDESLRRRILISMANKSTAGARATYKSYTYAADARIKDVNVFNGIKPIETYVSWFVGQDEKGVLNALIRLFADFCTVKVMIYAPTDIDNTSVGRVVEALSDEEIRPMTDVVKVEKAKEVNFDVVGTLYVYPDRNLNETYAKALESLDEGLKSLQKINADITVSEINDFLRIDGVKKVHITSPLDISVDRESIALVNTISITPEVYYEQL